MSSPNTQQRIEVTRHTMRVLDEWGVPGKEIIKLLALPGKIRIRQLDRYRDGEAFPESIEIMERVGHIAGIADALRTSFPRNAHMGVLWMKTPHRRFQNQTPLHVLAEQGLTGLRMVRSELDCAFSWDDSVR
jgi:hypothetical protein